MIEVNPKRTVTATRTNDAWPEGEHTIPGAVYVDPEQVYKDHLLFACPGCGRMGSIRVTRPKSEGGQSWELVAGELTEPESLTLAPSINCVGCCGWHGYLRNGIFESC